MQKDHNQIMTNINTETYVSKSPSAQPSTSLAWPTHIVLALGQPFYAVIWSWGLLRLSDQVHEALNPSFILLSFVFQC